MDAKTGSDPPLPQRAVVKFRHKVGVGKKDLVRPGVQGRSLFTQALSGHWWSVDPGVPGGQGDHESVWPSAGRRWGQQPRQPESRPAGQSSRKCGGESSLRHNRPVPALLGPPSVLEHPVRGEDPGWYPVCLSQKERGHCLSHRLPPTSAQQPGTSALLRSRSGDRGGKQAALRSTPPPPALPSSSSRGLESQLLNFPQFCEPIIK